MSKKWTKSLLNNLSDPGQILTVNTTGTTYTNVNQLQPYFLPAHPSNFQQIVAVKPPLTKTTSRSLLQEISCRRNYHIKSIYRLIVLITRLKQRSFIQDINKFEIYTKEEQEKIQQALDILDNLRLELPKNLNKAYLETDPENKYVRTPKVKKVVANPSCTGKADCDCVNCILF